MATRAHVDRIRPASARARRALARVTLGLVVAGTAAYLVWAGGAESRALRGLPEGERRALYARTLRDLETVCDHPPEALLRHCARQAQFLSEFPECDAACRGLVQRLFPPQPAR